MSNEPARRGVCLVLAAPSGAGKSSVLRALLADDPLLSLSVSATTRAPRPGERDGLDYHFTDRAGFDQMVANGEMLEWATVFGRSYGSPRAPVEAALAAGRDVAFDVDWQGHRLIRRALPEDTVSVFLLPPSLEALQARLLGRAGDSDEEIARRMAAARDEILHWSEFDHVVVNTVFTEAVDAVRSVLHAARCARVRQPGLERFVAGLLSVPPPRRI
jgi:guanylate kinase